jgi:putative flippase GtrA
MALMEKLRGKVGVRFARFILVAGVSLATTEVTLTICNGVLHMTSTPAALLSWFTGAVVSYVLSRWAWERKGRPDILRETLPFWVISAMVIVILTLANKFAYHAATWMHLHHAKQVLFVDLVWLVANAFTFLMRFVIFHFVLFADRGKSDEAIAVSVPDPAGAAAAAVTGGAPKVSSAPGVPSAAASAGDISGNGVSAAGVSANGAAAASNGSASNGSASNGGHAANGTRTANGSRSQGRATPSATTEASGSAADGS